MDNFGRVEFLWLLEKETHSGKVLQYRENGGIGWIDHKNDDTIENLLQWRKIGKSLIF